MTQEIAQMIQARLLEEVPDVSGFLTVQADGGSVAILGNIASNDPKVKTIVNRLVAELVPSKNRARNKVTFSTPATLTVSAQIDGNQGLGETVREDGVLAIDQVEILFMGELPINNISFSYEGLENREKDDFKVTNKELLRKAEAFISVLGYTDPIVVDQNLKVIDGNTRLKIAKERLRDGKTTKDTVPVVVLGTAGVKADTLRLALNRTSEFPRWQYTQVHAFTDSLPQLQPILEPIGFFGEKILPVSFFADSVFDYEIDPYSHLMESYKQEYGLAEWAKIQRNRAEMEAEARQRSMVKVPDESTQSLFEMKPEESDFIPTYDVEAETEDYTNALTEDAKYLTEIFDERTRKEKEARGHAWQMKRRLPAQVAADARAEAEAKEAENQTETSQED